jgi:hypothetical protein
LIAKDNTEHSTEVRKRIKNFLISPDDVVVTRIGEVYSLFAARIIMIKYLEIQTLLCKLEGWFY